jgi:N-acetylglucosaminyldiphosphoundecaprenol N-acetyl-beta-D-mannosaminyltransferase
MEEQQRKLKILLRNSKLPNRYNFASINIDAITEKEAIEKVKQYISQGNYHYQVSVNVAKLVYAQKDKKLKRAINNADIINADGMPIYIITKFFSGKKLSRMGGLDYMEGISNNDNNYRYYFWGARQDVLEEVISHYKSKFNINIVGHRNGYYDKNDLDDIIENINSLKIDVLFLALGTPLKEYLLYELKDRLQVKFAVGVGGAFDFVAGKTKRAPVWMQNIGLEWFFRLIQEPKRMWKRYLVTNTLFIYYVVKELIKKIWYD